LIHLRLPTTQKFNLQGILIYLFVFLGPLGTLLTPSFFPPSTRTYYFILFFFPLFFLTTKKKGLNILLLFLPLFLYFLSSAIYAHYQGPKDEAFPISRFFLLLLHFFFIVGSFNFLRGENSGSFFSHERYNRLINIYLISYFIGLVWGLSLYLAFNLNLISFDYLSRFNILTQYGWGFLRFNPGSYANEYAVLSSFVSTLIIAKFFSPGQSKKFSLLFLFVLPFIAMVLGTTKTSIISFSLSLLYLALINHKLLKILFSLGIFLTLLFSLFNYLHINLFNFFYASLFRLFYLSDSHLSRLDAYIDGCKKFSENLLFGTGFGSLPFLHNVYLQLLFELGILGFLLLFISLLFFLLSGKKKKIIFSHREKATFPTQLAVIAFIHVSIFALTNHNLFHHLTWFTLFITGLNHTLKEDKAFSTEKA
jgi:hypothetical protein